MCVVSMVMDHYYDRWWPKKTSPWEYTEPYVPTPGPAAPKTWPRKDFTPPAQPAITPEEIEEFRKLLDRAREYDRRNNEPDCELAEKRDKLKKLAEELGVAIDFL